MLFALLLGCSPADHTDQGSDDQGTDDTASNDTATDTAPGDCALLGDLVVTGTPAPGRTLTLSADPVDPAATLTWAASKGTVTGDGDGATWELPTDIAENHAVMLTVDVTATRDGCVDEHRTASLSVDWTLGDRTVVLYNPAVEGSADVAERYATFRDVDSTHLCGVATADPTNMAGADFPAFAEAVQACVDGVGPHVTTIVPVWGVPYRVADRIDDIGVAGVKATVSVDALLAWGIDGAAATEATWSPLYQAGDSRTGTYDPYVPFGDLRGSLPAYDHLYLVARIDGADAAAAEALVDRTAAAEAARDAGTLTGTVYVDANYGATEPATDDFGSYDSGNWNMIGVRDVFTADGRLPVVFDPNAEEFGTSPAPLTCPDALYYAGWYSYYHYNDVFTWAVGAIGGHLDSCSACDIRTGTTWSAMALQRGITATYGAVSEPYVAGMPEYDQLYLYLLQGASFGEAGYESTQLGLWMMVWVGDPWYRPYPSTP